MALNLQRARHIDNWGGFAIACLLYLWSRVRSLLGGPAQPRLGATTPPAPAAPRLRPSRVLAIKFYGLGNIVMLLPVLGALRRAYPDVEIDFLTSVENQTLLERSGTANQVIPARPGPSLLHPVRPEGCARSQSESNPRASRRGHLRASA